MALGVDSFKIEGRMKRPEYVAAAVSQFKEAVRGAQADMDLMAAVFSRSGFTKGYFDAKLGQEMFGTRQKEDVLASQKVLKKLSDMASKDVARVGVDFAFSMKENEPAVARLLRTGKDIPYRHRGKSHSRRLKLRPPKNWFGAVWNKTGGTFYYLNFLTCDLGEGLIYPASQLNSLRREALDKLTQLRGEIHKIPFHKPEKQPVPKHIGVQGEKLPLRAAGFGRYPRLLSGWVRSVS